MIRYIQKLNKPLCEVKGTVQEDITKILNKYNKKEGAKMKRYEAVNKKTKQGYLWDDTEYQWDEKPKIEDLYKKAKSNVDGLKVLSKIPNTSSIRATFNANEYYSLKGIRAVDMDLFDTGKSLFYAKNDWDRVDDIAAWIKSNEAIDPLIIVVPENDPKYPYVLEGAHRLGALSRLGKKQFPAMVVVEV